VCERGRERDRTWRVSLYRAPSSWSMRRDKVTIYWIRYKVLYIGLLRNRTPCQRDSVTSCDVCERIHSNKHTRTRTDTHSLSLTHRDVIECDLKEVDVQEIDEGEEEHSLLEGEEEDSLLEVIFRTTEVSLSPSHPPPPPPPGVVLLGCTPSVFLPVSLSRV